MYEKIEGIKIYGFCGNMGVGKDYIANEFIKEINKYDKSRYITMAFADHMKINGIVYNKLEYEKVFGEKDENTRLKLQKLGTEKGRNIYGENIWIDIIYNWIKIYNERGIKIFIITDVRFKNEIEFIKELGGKIIKIEALDRNKERIEKEGNNINIVNHESENYIKNYLEYDFLINNNKNENIEKQLKLLMKKIL